MYDARHAIVTIEKNYGGVNDYSGNYDFIKHRKEVNLENFKEYDLYHKCQHDFQNLKTCLRNFAKECNILNFERTTKSI